MSSSADAFMGFFGFKRVEGEQMKTIEVKVADLQGAALDWAVAIAGGLDATIEPDGSYVIERGATCLGWAGSSYSPSTDWAQGGPLIEKHGLGIAKFYEPVDGPILEGCEWAAIWRDDSVRMDGPTALIAAMRAIVAREMGDVVSVPSELLEAMQ